MFGLLYYMYKKRKHGVLFNGEVSEVKLIVALECMVYLVVLLACITSK